jgi:N-acetylneuraminic acid mutarotase
MRKTAVAMTVVFVFLATSCLVTDRPVSGAPVTENAWTTKASMNQARAGLGVVAVNGKIYAIGGSTASGTYPPDMFYGGFVGTNEEYDPTTDTWTTKVLMPTPRAYFAIAGYQNKIYCIGGAIGFSVDEQSGFYSYVESSVNEVYDTVTNTWETKTPLPYAQLGLQASVLNGKIYVVGGAYTYVYYPENDTWELKKQAPISNPLSVVVDDRLLATGTHEPLWDSPEQRILTYDAETDNWNEIASSKNAVVEGAAGATTGVKAPREVYVFGLKIDAVVLTVVNQVYDPETSTWAVAANMTVSRSDFGVAVVDDIFYVIGGYLRGSRHVTPTATNEQYIPFGYGTPPEIKLLSPITHSYNESSVPLLFTVDKQVSWMGYSLDGQDNVTVTGNSTITELTNGLHNVTVYAEDTFGNEGASETITFNVEVPEPFPVVPVVAASLATVAVVGIGLLVYFKKRLRRKSP